MTTIDRIENKAWSKLISIDQKLEALSKKEPYFAYTQEMIDGQVVFLNNEKAVWLEIMKLNEIHR